MDSLNLTNSLIGIVGIVVITWLVFQYAPMIQQALDEQLGGLTGSSANTSNQPLYKIFYKYQHESSEQWIRWILAQNEETKAKAYERLQTYLESPAPRLGLSAKDVIMAVAAFKRQDSFDTLSKFLDNVRSHLGTLKTIELFYPQLLASLVRLDLIRGAKILKEELEYFSQKRNTAEITYDNFRIKIVRTYKQMEILPKETRDCIIATLCNGSYSAAFREEVIKVIAEHLDTDVSDYVYPKVLRYFLQDEVPAISEESEDVLENLFYTFKDFSKGHKETWSLLLEACYKEKTYELYMNLLTGLVADRTEKFENEQLLDILNIKEPAKDAFRSALQERNYVTDEEMTIFRSKVKAEDLEFSSDTVVIEKSRKTKSVASSLLEQYKRLRVIVEKNFSTANKSERRVSHTIKLITGTSDREKLYLLRALAANENRALVYIDIARMIYNIPQLNKLISTISNAKPALVYVDNLLHIFETNLDEEGLNGLRLFLKTLRELAILPTVSFFGSISISGLELQQDLKLKQILASGMKGDYELSINLDNPTDEEKVQIINDILGKITTDKIDRSFKAAAILLATEGKSFLEFWSYLCDFFEKALMVKGRIVDPKYLFSDLPDEENNDENPDENSKKTEINEESTDESLGEEAVQQTETAI